MKDPRDRGRLTRDPHRYLFSETNVCFVVFQLSFHAVAFKLEPNSKSKGDRVVRGARVSGEMHPFSLNLSKLSLILFPFHE